MGTEMGLRNETNVYRGRSGVKLNNPQMGTEINI